MQGHARLVERKIRLWIVQQEFNRQKQGQLAPINARDYAPGELPQVGRRLKL
jgi:hypothetical protein